MNPFTRQELETGLLMLEDPGYLQTNAENELLGRLIDAYPTGEYFQMGDWIRKLVRTLDIEERGYHPWTAQGISEVEYWKRQYLASRRDSQALYSALAFIRDCEDDEELAPMVTVPFLKEQARRAMEQTPL